MKVWDKSLLGYMLPKKGLERVVKSMAPSGLGTGVRNLVEAIRKDSVQGQGIRAMYSVRLDVVPNSFGVGASTQGLCKGE